MLILLFQTLQLCIFFPDSPLSPLCPHLLSSSPRSLPPRPLPRFVTHTFSLPLPTLPQKKNLPYHLLLLLPPPPPPPPLQRVADNTRVAGIKRFPILKTWELDIYEAAVNLGEGGGNKRASLGWSRVWERTQAIRESETSSEWKAITQDEEKKKHVKRGYRFTKRKRVKEFWSTWSNRKWFVLAMKGKQKIESVVFE